MRTPWDLEPVPGLLLLPCVTPGDALDLCRPPFPVGPEWAVPTSQQCQEAWIPDPAVTVGKHIKLRVLQSTWVRGCTSPTPGGHAAPAPRGLWRPPWSSARNPAGQALGGGWRGQSRPGS